MQQKRKQNQVVITAAITPPSTTHLDDEEEEEEEESETSSSLVVLFPESTKAERRRFLTANHHDVPRAKKQWKAYHEWRTKHELHLDYSEQLLLKQKRLQHQHQDNGAPINDVASGHEAEEEEKEEDLIWTKASIAARRAHQLDKDVSNTEDTEDDDDRPIGLPPRLVQLAHVYKNKTYIETSLLQSSSSTTDADNKKATALLPSSSSSSVSSSYLCDTGGHLILHVMPGLMDLSIGSPSAYALALALYIHLQLDEFAASKKKKEKESNTTATSLVEDSITDPTLALCIDVRGGVGWPNVGPMQQLGFMQQVISLLLQMFPERLYQCLVYPIPSNCLWIWNRCVKVWLDDATQGRIQILTTTCLPVNRFAAPPYEAMAQSLGQDAIGRFLELSRRQLYRYRDEKERLDAMKRMKEAEQPQQQS